MWTFKIKCNPRVYKQSINKINRNRKNKKYCNLHKTDVSSSHGVHFPKCYAHSSKLHIHNYKMHNIKNNKDTVLKSRNGETLSAVYHTVEWHNLHGSIPIEGCRMSHMRHILQELNSIPPTLQMFNFSKSQNLYAVSIITCKSVATV